MTLSKFLNPKTDTAFKKIFGTEKHQNILIRFINDILGFTGDDQIKEVEFLSPVQDPEIASKKQSIVDVLCRDNKGVTHIIEMQVADTKGFEKRAQYYAAKAYSRQLNKGDNKYQNLKEVIFIAIADCMLFPNKPEYLSRHVILDEKSYEQDLKDFSFTFIELPKFKKKKEDNLESTIEQWCRFFKYGEETTEEELERIIGGDNVIKEAYEAINQFNWSEKELLAYEEDLKRTRDNIAIMDAAIEKAEAKGRVEGEAKGRVEGEAKGRVEGEAKGRVEGEAKGRAEGEVRGRAEGEAKEKVMIARNLLSQNIDMTIISAATGLSVQEIKKLKT